jgi:hypothetical protein
MADESLGRRARESAVLTQFNANAHPPGQIYLLTAL